MVKVPTPPTPKDIEVALVISNSRAPHQDDKAIQLVLMHSKDLGLTKIFFNGDMIDYFNRSDIDRNPLRIFTAKDIATMKSEIKKRERASVDAVGLKELLQQALAGKSKAEEKKLPPESESGTIKPGEKVEF